MTLAQPEEKKIVYQQPVFQFDQKNEPPKEEVMAEEKKISLSSPSPLERDGVRPNVKTPVANSSTTVDKSAPEIIHFELSSTPDPTPIQSPATITAEIPKHQNQTTNKEVKDTVAAPTSGGYLAKPSKLYVGRFAETTRGIQNYRGTTAFADIGTD